MNVQLADVEKTVQVVVAQFDDFVGAGAIAKMANAVFEILGVEKGDGSDELYQVTQQMMTNYVKNGLIDGQKRSSMKGEVVDKAAAAAWLTKYAAKKVGLVVSGGSSKGVAQSTVVARAREALMASAAQEIKEVKAPKASKTDKVEPAAEVKQN